VQRGRGLASLRGVRPAVRCRTGTATSIAALKIPGLHRTATRTVTSRDALQIEMRVVL
jgi:hypothetical protein